MCKCIWFSYSCFWEAHFPFQWRQLRDDCCTQWLAGDTWCSTEEYLFISFVSAGHRLIPINGSNLEVREFSPFMFIHCRMLVWLTGIAQNTGKQKRERFSDNWQDVWMDRSCSCTFFCKKTSVTRNIRCPWNCRTFLILGYVLSHTVVARPLF